MSATRLETIIANLETARSLDDLQSLIECIRDVYDVDHAIYHSVSGTGEQYAALTYSPDWVDRYVGEDYARIDPVVTGSLRRFHPVDWKRLDWTAALARDFLHEAIGAGVGNQGYSVPIRGPNGQFALFTFNKRASDRDWAFFTSDHVREMLLIAHYVHQKSQRIHQIEEARSLKELSPRERDALHYLALGMGRARIAEKLNISEHTLRVYIDSARYKMGALNTTHTVALAMSRGVIVL
ncbi:MAG: autoinducer binding domain-containing protein [Paracoccaceae bacterium]